MRRSVAALAAAAAVGPLVLLVGCDPGPEHRGAAGALRAVENAVKQQQATSARVAMRVSIRSDEFASDVDEQGVIDFQHKLGELHLTLVSGGTTAQVQVILTPETTYVKLGEQPWMTMGESGPLSFALGGNPDSHVLLLRGATGAFKVGREQVGEAATNHYRGKFNLALAMLRLDADGRSLGEFAGFDRGGHPFDAWIDDGGRLLKVAFRMSTTEATRTEITRTEEFTDFGVAVHVQPPPLG